MPIKLISTDFDGTIFAEFADPPVPAALQNQLRVLQKRGVVWVINTGRDLGSLLETLARAEVAVHPDALVLVEREIYVRRDGEYVPLTRWNTACAQSHQELFARVSKDIPGLVAGLKVRHPATFYEDAFSPLCVLAETVAGADAVQRELDAYAQGVADLCVVRNDVYIRFAHVAYNKGSALAEIARRLQIAPEEILAAGDHYNDLPMLDRERARWLVAPANAIPEVQARVKSQEGYVSHRPQGEGVALGIEYFLERV